MMMTNHQVIAGHQGRKVEGGKNANVERMMEEKRILLGDTTVMAGHQGLPKEVEVGGRGNANAVEMMVKKRMLVGETMVIPVQCNVSSEWVLI